MELIKAENIYKSYQESDGELQILKDLSLTVLQGETIAITGESGSGKSTLLHILGLLDKADSGTILYRGESINSTSSRAAKFRTSKLGFVFQFHYLLSDFTALENIALPHFYLTGSRKKSEAKAKALLQSLDLLSRAGSYPHQLSGGEQQRVAIARALINDPDIIFADEPAGNLDKKHSDMLIDLLLEYNQQKGQTFVLVTHDSEIAARMHHHYKLENGCLSEW